MAESFSTIDVTSPRRFVAVVGRLAVLMGIERPTKGQDDHLGRQSGPRQRPDGTALSERRLLLPDRSPGHTGRRAADDEPRVWRLGVL